MRHSSALLAFLAFLVVGASAAGRTQVNRSAREVIAEALPKLKARRTRLDEKIRLVRALGALGSDAAPAIGFLLSNGFFYEQGGRAAKTHPLRMATVDALVKIGKPAVPEVVALLSTKPGGKGGDKVHRSNKFDWRWWAGEILRRMSQTETVDVILPSLEKEMRSAKQKGLYYSVLALMGPKAVGVLKREARRIVAKGVRSKAEANNIRRLGELIGPEIADALDAVVPQH